MRADPRTLGGDDGIAAELAKTVGAGIVEALRFLIVGGGIGQVDAAVAVHGDPVVGLGQVLGGQPSVHGMPGQAVEAQRGGQLS